MTRPIISIAIATLNSEKTLEQTLKSLVYQTYLKKKVEILVIDGGSKDKTQAIAQKYNCTIIPNPKVELVFAKQIAFLEATGKYLLFLDSDEILQNKNSLMQKYEIFQLNSKIKAVMLGGYQTDPHSSSLNYYINEFGDPFSFFVYHETKSNTLLAKNWKEKYQDIIIQNTKNALVFDFFHAKDLPLIELWAGGSMIDLTYCRKTFLSIKKNPGLLAHLFYAITEKKMFTAISKADYTIHNSTPTLSKYLKKIASRVKNNVYMTDMGVGGFLGRHQKKSQFAIKKYLFIPYSLSIILPIYDAFYLMTTRRKIVYLLHPFLCLYTTMLILYYYFLKSLGIKPKMKSYGN